VEGSGRKRAWRSVPRPRRRKPRDTSVERRTPVFVVDIALASGAELRDRLLEQGLAPDEVIFKYFWPRYAPPADSGIHSFVKSENLGGQFERLIAMHQEAPSAIPMPLATVRNVDAELVGYLLERIEGETLQALIDLGNLDEARRRLSAVEKTVAALHAKSIPHGDLNASNIIAADDGRTLLVDPVANPGPGTKLEDEICLRQLRELVAG
jgi:aminoglycoside phosphotransferase (APT) family kinase protein